MIRIDSTLSVDPHTGAGIDTTTNAAINARHPKAGVFVKAMEKLHIAREAIAALNACDLSAPYVRDFLKTEIPLTLPFLITEKRVESTRKTPHNAKPKPKQNNAPTITRPTPIDTITLTATANVTHNVERNGIEIQFNVKPSADTIAALKQKGFKWSGRQSLWYCPYTYDGYAWATSINGNSIDSTQSTPLITDHSTLPTSPSIDSTQSTAPASRIDSTPLITDHSTLTTPSQSREATPVTRRPTPAQLIAAMLAAKQQRP